MGTPATEMKDARRFGLILACILGVIAGLSWLRHHPQRAELLAAAGAFVVALALIIPPLWLRIFRLWMKGAMFVGWVVTLLLLSVFFYLVFTPYGLFLRLAGRAPLDLEWRDGRMTYWVGKSTGGDDPRRYERPF